MGGVHARAPVPPSPHQRSSQTAPHSGIGAGTGAQGHRGTGAQGHRGTGAGARGTHLRNGAVDANRLSSLASL
jgi:hypothetical protein